MSRLVLVRHGRPRVDPTVPPAEWGLDEAHTGDVRALASRLGRLDSPRLLASTERKAVETAQHLGLPTTLEQSHQFVEVAKPWYDDRRDQHEATAQYLAGAPAEGWEPRPSAVARFQAGVDQFGTRDLVVVTHGTVMTAWLASIGAIADPFAFWSGLGLPDMWEGRL